MEEPICKSNTPQASLLLIPDTDPDAFSREVPHPENVIETESFLSLPAIWYPGMSDEDWADELSCMVNRSIITRGFVLGNLSYEEYLDGLSDTGIDVYPTLDAWDDGKTFR
jgi:hypothetical protein